MKKNEYKIETVEVFYNGAEEKFDAFLRAVVRDYVAADALSPEGEDILAKESA